MTHRALRFAGAALIVFVGVWAGARVYSSRMAVRVRSGSMAVPAGEASAPTPSDLIAEFDAAVPPPAKIPERLPDFSLQGRDGISTSIKTWAGKSLVINFWATWCAPCRREIPLLEALHSEWAARGVAVVGVAVDHRDTVLAYADELKITYPLLIGEQDALDAAAALGVESPVLPFTVFTDRQGEVVALYLGELHKAQADLILAVVQNLNQDQVALPQARRSIAEGLHALRGTDAG
jgi:thiol-disulfide isomerase/thioredoxin